MDESGRDPVESIAPVSRRSMSSKGWRVFIVVAVIAVVALLGVLPLQVCRDWAFVCENTGAQKGYRQWCVGLQSGQWYRESRLEQFMRQQHPSDLAYRWTSYAGTGRNIMGQSCSFRHAFPQVNTIMLSPAWFDRYVDTLDDAGRLALYRQLVSGDRQAIQAEEKKIEKMALAQAWPIR